jgi:hypothetical protein
VLDVRTSWQSTGFKLIVFFFIILKLNTYDYCFAFCSIRSSRSSQYITELVRFGFDGVCTRNSTDLCCNKLFIYLSVVCVLEKKL